jgi:outer membrane protein, multidrug efflux system
VRKLSILVATAALSACAVGPDYRPPETSAPASFVSAREPNFAAEEVEQEFWKSFQDPQLDRLVTEALAVNHDIRIAEANLRRARALRGESRFDLGPTVTAGGGHTEAKASERQLRGIPVANREERYYDAGFDAAWELDFFGRVRRGVEARNAELGAAAATLQDVRVSVTAEVARNYFELRGLQRQLAVARGNAENQRNTLELTELRMDAGTGTELDTVRAQAQLASTLAAIPNFEAAVNRAIFRLGVLTARQPAVLLDELALARALPELPSIQRIGTPEALLRRRPDVRVAERELAAATARIGIAVGDLFPKISFSGNFGYDAVDSADLGKAATEAYAFGPVISWAAFDLGRVRQRIKGSRAAADGALARYEQAVLLALEDAESSLTTYSRSRARQEHLRGAAQASAQAADLARLRFDGGVADFLDVLDAQRTLLGAESELARGETDTATALIAVYKALGGGINYGDWEVGSPRS